MKGMTVKLLKWFLACLAITFFASFQVAAQGLETGGGDGPPVLEFLPGNYIFIQQAGGDWLLRGPNGDMVPDMNCIGGGGLNCGLPTELECTINPMNSQCHALGVPIIVVIAAGAIGGGVAASAQGGSGWQIALGALFGGVTGLYGAVAGLATGTARVVWYAHAVTVQGIHGAMGRPTP